MIWGIGVVAVLAGVTWWLRAPGTNPWGRAFGVLVFYGLLFMATLLKIWWTASKTPAVTLDEVSLGYQPLQSFRPKSIPLAEIVSCGMRTGTQSLRFVRKEPSGRLREFFLNLAIIDGRNEFMHRLGRCLEERGLVAEPGATPRWAKPGYDEKFVG